MEFKGIGSKQASIVFDRERHPVNSTGNCTLACLKTQSKGFGLVAPTGLVNQFGMGGWSPARQLLWVGRRATPTRQPMWVGPPRQPTFTPASFLSVLTYTLDL